MASRQFHWFVAWRYLMERPRRVSPIVLLVVDVFIALAIACFTIAMYLDPGDPVRFIPESRYRVPLLFTALGFGLLCERTIAIGVIRYYFTFFTTVSISGLMIGTGALVIVLSVMNGFETDLRDKILGSNAHIRISKEEGAFTEYRQVAKAVQGVPQVLAHTSYLSSEVVVVAGSNYDNVIIKGIEPKTVSAVTDLGEDIHQPNALENLWPQDAGVVPPPDATKYVPSDASVVDPAPDDMDIGEEEPMDLSGATDSEEEEALPIQAFDGGIGQVLPVYPDRERLNQVSPEIARLPGLLAGDELVKKIHLYVGDEVRVVSPLGENTPLGPVPRTRSFRVAGTFFTGMYEYDLKFVYVELSSLQQFLDVEDEVTGIEIRVRNPDRTEAVLEEIRARIGPDYRVQDWKELNRNLFSALKLEKIAMFLVLVIIILVASFSIIGNLIMVVVEKAKEIAVLKTIGTSDVAVRRLFVTQGLGIGGVGTVLGVGYGLLMSFVIATVGVPLDPDVYYIDRLPIRVEPFVVLAVAVAGVALSMIATLYPATMAARLRPVEGMRYE